MLISIALSIQWCLNLVDSDLVNCRDLVDYFCFLSGNKKHMSFIYKLKANFCGRKKEGHFHDKNFLRALK